MQRYENYFQHILSTDQNKASTEPGDEDDLDDINRDGLVLKKMARQVVNICTHYAILLPHYNCISDQ